MDIEAGVMELESPEIGGEPEVQSEHQETEQADPRKEAKAYSDWLKAKRDVSPEEAKYYRQAKEDHGSRYALHQLDPRGIDGVREKYALLDSIQHGELKGAEAVQAMAAAVEETAEVDRMIADGNEKVWELFGDEFNSGLSKLAPSLLNRIQSSDPEGYARAILPHLVEQLKHSELLRNHNAVVDILEQQPPSWLPAERREQWWQEKFENIARMIGANSNWLNAQAKRAGEVPRQADGGRGKEADRTSQLDTRERNLNWNTKIQPSLLTDAKEMFRGELKPYFSRLRLDQGSVGVLEKDFLERLLVKGNEDKNFKAQMDRYFTSRNPDPAAVRNFAKAGLHKHAKAVMQSLIDERYKGMLGAKPKPAAVAQKNGNGAPVGPKEFVVGSRPQESMINFRHPKFADFRHQNKFPLKDGRIAILRG